MQGFVLSLLFILLQVFFGNKIASGYFVFVQVKNADVEYAVFGYFRSV